jgi:uncharacterized membrane protein
MPKVKHRTTVYAPIDLVYQAWHNFENFPRFMSNVEEVRVVGGGRSHWKAKAALGAHAEWDAEITLDEPNRAIGWRSIRGSSSGIDTAGRVNFEEKQGATDVEVTIEYTPPGGLAGDVVSKVFASPERQVAEDLQRFKDVMERGVELSGLNFATSIPGADAHRAQEDAAASTDR